MFEQSSPLAIVQQSKTDISVYRIVIDRAVQKSISDSFSSAVEDMHDGKSAQEFTASYKLENDEYFKIGNFIMPDVILDAIRSPLGAMPYSRMRVNDNGVLVKFDEPTEEDGTYLDYPEIKAVFVGERIEEKNSEIFHIAFQKIRREQHLTQNRHNLFFDKDSFHEDKRFGIGITDFVDCYFNGDELEFNSFYFARQIFDLSEYYRSATDEEVNNFTTNNKLSFDNASNFTSWANTYIRRKIAAINDSGILEQYTAFEIQQLAKTYAGADIKISDNKVCIPDNKDEAVWIVGFLDEEAYRGPFSQDLIVANSKRRIKSKQG